MAVDHIDQNNKEAMCAPVSAILYCLIQLAALAAAAIATPIDMFRPYQDYAYKNTPCLTLWGQKPQCFSNKYEAYSKDIWAACPQRQKLFQFAQTAALISTGVLLLGLVVGFCTVGCCPYYRPVIIIMNGVAAVASAAVVGVMTDSYYNRRGPEDVQTCAALKDPNGPNLRFGTGFVLFIISCLLAAINMSVVDIPF